MNKTKNAKVPGFGLRWVGELGRLVGIGEYKEINRTKEFDSSNERSLCTDYGYAKRFDVP